MPSLIYYPDLRVLIPGMFTDAVPCVEQQLETVCAVHDVASGYLPRSGSSPGSRGTAQMFTLPLSLLRDTIRLHCRGQREWEVQHTFNIRVSRVFP